jgi:hypothetical protein
MWSVVLDLFPEVHCVEHVVGSSHVAHLRFRSGGVGLVL